MNVDAVIARRTFRQIWIGAGAWALVFGVTVATSALTYVSSFPTLASRQQLAATTSGDAGLAVVLGPVSAIDTVGGYTVYKCFVFLTTIGAIWALLAATRLLRGEEDAGRWQLVLAGSTRPARATAATLAALLAAVAIVFAGTSSITLLAARDRDVGFSTGDTFLYGLSLALVPAVFVGVGALASQLSRTRRVATGVGMVVFGVTFLLRMVADSGHSTRWLLWFTPFGWTERIAPFTENDARPLVPAALTVILLYLAATLLASRRDAGDGLLAARDVSVVRPFGLRSAIGAATRFEVPVLAAWCAGVAATAFLYGIVAKLTLTNLPDSMRQTLDRFGVQGSFVEQYLGVAFLLVATVLALMPAGQVGAASEEETSGRLVHVLARSTNRAAWFSGRLILCAAGVAAAGLLAGPAAWLGAKTQGVDLDLVTMTGAGLNVVPTALVALGVGALVLSVAPRAAASSVYAVVIWSLLVDLLASMISNLSWLGHASLFHYMALVPAQDADAMTLAITVAVAVGLGAAATLRFERRDVRAG